MLEGLDNIQKILNDTINDTKDNWDELKKYNKQLSQLEESTNNVEMGGIKLSELNKAMGTLTKYLEGAFNEVNKSVEDMNKTIQKTKEEVKNDSK